MYNIKDVIIKLKQIANIDSNINLAKELNVSYNTLNTWIKRGKLPQEVIISFCKKYNCSLDYLLLDKNQNSNKDTIDKKNIFTFYGYCEKLDSSFKKLNLTLQKDILHSGGIYLLEKNSIFLLVQAFFDPFSNIVKLNNKTLDITLSIEEFKKYNQGLVIS